MKTRRVLLVIITIMMLTFTTSARAAYEKKGVLTGHIEFKDLQMVNLGCKADPYKFYNYQFVEDGTGTHYTAYCVSPDYKGSSSLNVSCEVATPSTYATAYYLIQKYGDWQGSSLALNVGLRAAGMADLDYQADFSAIDLDEAHRWRLAFTASRVYYMGITEEMGRDTRFDDYVIRSGEGVSGMAMYVEAQNNVNTRGRGGADKGIDEAQDAGVITDTAGATGKIVKLDVKEVRQSEDGGAKTVVYTMTNVTGVPISKLKATPAGNVTASISNWNGMTGELTVMPTSETECDGEVIISAADTKSNTVSGETLYICKGNGDSTQKYLMIGPDLIGDKFKVQINCDECDPKDCGTVPPPGELKKFNGNNCCEPGGQKDYAEFGINDWLCYDKKLDVQFYKLKCGGGAYLDTQIDELFCEIYCAQSMNYELPGPTTAKSGRYFKLAKSSYGVAGPHVKAYLRCRTLVHWDVWYKKYYAAVEEQVKGYNQHQENKAYQMVWEKLIEVEGQHKMSMNGEYGSQVACPWEYTWTKTCYDDKGFQTSSDSGGNSDNPTEAVKDVQARTYKFEYAPASDKKYTYNILKIKANGLPNEQASQWGKEYSYLDIIYDSTKNPQDGTRYIHEDEATEWEDNWTEAHDKVEERAKADYESAKASKPSEGAGCTVNINDSAPECDEKPEPATKVIPQDKVDHYKGLKEAGNAKFKSGTTNAKDFEERLTVCDKWGQENVKLDEPPDMDFSYTQAYINEVGRVQTDIRTIPFTRACNSTQAHGASEDGASGFFGGDADKFSGKHYKTGKDKVTDFAGSMPDSLDPPGSKDAIIGLHKDGAYQAEKQFTTDDVASIECTWDDAEGNTLYTLVPSGTVGYTTTENYTKHNREYFVTRTHLEGKFETYFTLNGVGKDSFWDDFLYKGETCAGDEPDKNATCWIVIDDEITKTGDCNQIMTPQSNPCDCDWGNKKCGQVEPLFEYKEVEPSDIFVNDGIFQNKIAYNWLVDPEGQSLLSRMESDGKQDKTYAPENLTYSFTLNPGDLKAIRAYNKSRLYQGGYTDFQLDCKGAKEEPKKQCYSKFLNSIANGSGGRVDGLSLNTFNGNIDEVRSRLSW